MHYATSNNLYTHFPTHNTRTLSCIDLGIDVAVGMLKQTAMVFFLYMSITIVGLKPK